MKITDCLLAALVGSIFGTAQTWFQWPVTQGGNGHWYGVTRTPHRGWGPAEAEAQTHANGHLVAINSAAEQRFLERTFLFNGPYAGQRFWIGFNDFGSEGHWVWSTGEPVTYTNWCRPEEPNNYENREHGGVINWNGDGCWNDYFEAFDGSNPVELYGIIEIHSTAPPVEIEAWPPLRQVTTGANVAFRAFTYGLTESGQFQWKFGDTEIPGATNAVLALTSVTRAQRGDYRVELRLPGRTVTSQPARLEVTGSPTIARQPTSRVAPEGSDVEFSVTASGEGPFTYQWFFNASPIPGADQPTLALRNVKAPQTGGYSVRVSGPDGAVTSTTAKLTVIPPGYTVVYTHDFESVPGPEWSLRRRSVTPVGNRQFLGKFGNEQLRLSIAGLPSHSEVFLSYDLLLLDSWDGNVEDVGPDLLTVTGADTVLLHSTFSNVHHWQSYPGSHPEEVYPPFTGATERGTLGYKWVGWGSLDSVYGLRHAFRHSGTNLTIFFEARNLEPLDNESWGLDNVVVAVATIPPGSAPEILGPPRSQIVGQGGTAVFKALASGTPPLRYQWRFNNTPLPGATNELLVVTNVQAANAGRYSVVVENDYGLVSRSPAELVVVVSEPTGRTENAGGSTRFEVEVAGTAEIQWLFNGEVLPGQTNRALVLSGLDTARAGAYQALISVPGTSWLTPPAHLFVPVPGAPGSIRWSFSADSPSPIYGTPALGYDGTLYFTDFAGRLFALTPEGVQKWQMSVGWSVASPAVGPDGTIYVDGGNALHAVTPDGRKLWSRPYDGNGYIYSTPAVGADGTIYAAPINPGTILYAFNPDGTEKWRFDAGVRIYAASTIGADGTVYFGTLDNSAKFFAVRPDGNLLWQRTARKGWDYGETLITREGYLVFSSDHSYRYDRSGQTLWELGAPGHFTSSGALGADGRLVQADNAGNLFAVSATGVLLWTTNLGAVVQLGTGVAISDRGTAYVFAEDLRLHAVSADGKVLWRFATGGRIRLDTPHARPSPKIGPDGTIYLGSLEGRLYAIQGDGPPADSPWPMYRRDAQNTGRMPLLLEATNLVVSVGAEVVLRAITSEPDATFQWRHNGQTLPGATNAQLRLTRVPLTAAGEYDVILTCANGTVRSPAARLVVDGTFTKITEDPVVREAEDSTGAAWGDYDGDGWQDLWSGRLYRNQRDGTFQRATNLPPTLLAADFTAGAWADGDNDGQLDLFLTRWELNNRLFYRDETGGFVPVTTGNVVTDGGYSVGAAWGDYDGDGNADLLVVNRSGQRIFLYRSNGDGTFIRVTSGSVANELGRDFTGAAWADYDSDGDLDLLVTGSDGVRLFRNDRGQFTKLTSGSLPADTALTQGASWGDFDNDGDLDVYLLPGRLYRNEGHGIFTPVAAGAATASGAAGLGAAWGDYDNDGYLDLFVWNPNFTGNRLFRNRGDGTFEAAEAGSVTRDLGDSYAAAWADYDNDGFLDLFVANRNKADAPVPEGRQNFLYRNNGNGNRWLKLRLIGTLSNGSAVGAKVRVLATIHNQPQWQMREISGGLGSGAQNALDVHFGLGDATNVAVLRIEWPSGIVQEFRSPGVNQFLSVTEPPVLEARGFLPGGEFELVLTSRGGFDYRIEATENFQTWVAVAEARNVRGSVQVVDRGAGHTARRFYRAVQR